MTFSNPCCAKTAAYRLLLAAGNTPDAPRPQSILQHELAALGEQRLLLVVIEPAPGLSTEPAGGNVLPEERTRAVLRVAEAVV